MHSLVVPLINLSILIAVLVYYLRAPLKAFIKIRHESVRDELERVAEQLKLAQEKYDEFSAKLKAMQAEIVVLRDQARQDGEAIKLRLVNDGKRVSVAIVMDAKAAAEALIEDLRISLKRELAASVLSRAELLVLGRLTSEDRKRFRLDFSKQVESTK